MIRRALILVSAWVGFDFAFVRDLSPFFSYYGAFGVGRVDDVIGLAMLSGAVLAAFGWWRRHETAEHVGYAIAGLAWFAHASGFFAHVLAMALGERLPVSPLDLSWYSLMGTPIVYTVVGLTLVHLSRTPTLRCPR